MVLYTDRAHEYAYCLTYIMVPNTAMLVERLHLQTLPEIQFIQPVPRSVVQIADWLNIYISHASLNEKETYFELEAIKSRAFKSSYR